MASYAGSQRSNAGRVLDTQQITEQLKRGKDGSIKDGAADQFLESWFASGGGITAGAAKKYQKVGRDNQFKNPRDELHSRMFGENPLLSGRKTSDNVKGLSGVSLPEGSVYFGSAAVTTPGSSSRTRNGGHTSTKGSTTYTPGFLPRELFESMGARQEEPSSAPAGEQKPYEPGPDLAAAREAYDRSMAYQEGSGSAAALAFDANLKGGDLLNNIYAQGDTYEKRFDRFLDQQGARANLQAAEIGNATREAIAGLSPDIKVPEYTDPFESGLYNQLLKDVTRKKVA